MCSMPNCKEIRIFLFSDRYVFAIHTLSDFVFHRLEASFAYESVLRCKRNAVHMPRRNSDTHALYQDRNCTMSLDPEHGMRLVGHIDQFCNGSAVLLDIALTARKRIDGMEIYCASGTMMIGDDEFVFAPAHSCAIIIQGENNRIDSWLSAIQINHKPLLVGIVKNKNDEPQIVLYNIGTNEKTLLPCSADSVFCDTTSQIKRFPVCIKNTDGQLLDLSEHWFIHLKGHA